MRHTRMMSSPVDDNFTVAGNKVYQQLKKYLIITGPGGSANGFDPGNASQPNAVSLTRYIEPNTLAQAQFSSVPSLTDAAVPLVKPGEGFFLFFRGDRSSYTPATSFTSNKVNPPFATPESFAMTYTGKLNQRNIPVTLYRTANGELYDGYNVIGNPYAATIDFSLLYSANSANIENQYILPKPDKTGTMSYSGVSGTVANGGTMATDAQARYIQPGQALYVVKKDAGTGTYNTFFTESMKATGSSPARLLSVPLEKSVKANTSMSVTPMLTDVKGPWSVLRMSLQDHINNDEAVVLFKVGYQKELEGSDIPYFSGSTVSFSTLSADGKSLAINFMPELKDSSEIRLNFNASASVPLKLNFTDISATHGYKVFLRDNYISQTALTEIHPNSVYELAIDKTIATSYGANRLVLIIKPEENVPLKLVSFIGSPANHFIHLRWKLQNEINADHFEVERSSDNKLFSKIGDVRADTLSLVVDYSFIDKSPLEGENYYRLKRVCVNGKSSISESILVKMDFLIISIGKNKNIGIQVYPNPAVSEIFVTIKSAIKSDVILSIYDLQGKRLQKISFSKNSIIKSDISRLKEGLYLLEIKNSQNNRIIGNAKFYKNYGL